MFCPFRVKYLHVAINVIYNSNPRMTSYFGARSYSIKKIRVDPMAIFIILLDCLPTKLVAKVHRKVSAFIDHQESSRRF